METVSLNGLSSKIWPEGCENTLSELWSLCMHAISLMKIVAADSVAVKKSCHQSVQDRAILLFLSSVASENAGFKGHREKVKRPTQI